MKDYNKYNNEFSKIFENEYDKLKKEEEKLEYLKKVAEAIRKESSVFDNFKDEISDIIYEFERKNKDYDFKNVDLIIKRRNGKYVIEIDNKREEKIKEIFKDENI